MKKFLLLSFLMVVLVSAVSFGQTTTINYYSDIYYSDPSERRLTYSYTPVNSNGSFEAHALVNTSGLPAGVEINLMPFR
jgi:hypothetical protein